MEESSALWSSGIIILFSGYQDKVQKYADYGALYGIEFCCSFLIAAADSQWLSMHLQLELDSYCKSLIGKLRKYELPASRSTSALHCTAADSKELSDVFCCQCVTGAESQV